MQPIIRLYDSFAHRYAQNCREKQYQSPQILFDEIAKKTDVSQKHVLDVGIGCGESASYFTKAGGIVTGIDGSREMLKRCELEISDRLYQIDLTTNESFPFTENSFDISISNCVFRYLEDFSHVLKEMARVTKNDGYVAFTTTSAKNKNIVSVPSGHFIESRYVDKTVQEYIHNPLIVLGWMLSANFCIEDKKQIVSQTFDGTQEFCELYVGRVVKK